MKRIVVTGAAGFIGSHLCRRVKQTIGAEIVAVDSLRSGDWMRTPSGLVQLQRDIANIDFSEWTEVLGGVDVLFHLAAEKYNSSKSSPEQLLRTNVLATERLFRAAALSNVKRVVFTSSLYAYGSMGPRKMLETDLPRPHTLYGASKVMGEHLLHSIDKEYGLSWNVARLFFIYGSGQFAEGGYKSVIVKNFERIARGESPVIFGDGKQSLDYVHIDDCIDALLELAYSPQSRKMLNVASGRGISVLSLTKKMLRIANSDLNISFGPSDWTAGSRRVGDPGLIERSVGWRAKKSLDSGLREVYDSQDVK